MGKVLTGIQVEMKMKTNMGAAILLKMKTAAMLPMSF
jgi:hypothetical protein